MKAEKRSYKYFLGFGSPREPRFAAGIIRGIADGAGI